MSLKVVYLQRLICVKISKSFYGYNRQTLGTFFQVSKKPMKMALFRLRAELQEMLRSGGLEKIVFLIELFPVGQNEHGELRGQLDRGHGLGAQAQLADDMV